MALVLDGGGTITGLTAGGLPDASITQSDLATSVRQYMHGCLVRRGSNQTINTSTWTKIAFDSEVYDVGNCFDNTTNYRFQPTVAGYYFFQTMMFINTSVTTGGQLQINPYKNGSASIQQFRLRMAGGADNCHNVCGSVYMNGTTDYLEIYVYQSDASSHIFEGGTSDIRTHFSAFLIGV